jgi:type III restriction enzyme
MTNAARCAYLRPDGADSVRAAPRAGIETLDFEKVKNELITNHGIPASEIVVATGEEKGLEQIDAITSWALPIRPAR